MIPCVLLILAALAAAKSSNDELVLTILHTSDIHGWIYNHTHDPTYTARLGEIGNFITHLKNDKDPNEMVLFFDTGDLIQGTGLSDATDIPGQFVLDQIKKMPYDSLCIGNHELINTSTVEYITDSFKTVWKSKYLGWNVQHTNETKILTDKYYEIPINITGNETDYGKILVAGFLLDMDAPNDLVKTQTVESIVNSDEFSDFLKIDNVKVYIFLCHFGISSDELKTLYNKVDSVRKDAVKIFLTGHTHKIDSTILSPNNSIAMESGFYGQTLGKLEVDINLSNNQARFDVQAINWNNETLMDSFNVSDPLYLNDELGKRINSASEEKFKELNLSTVIGCAPYNYNNTPPAVTSSPSLSSYSFPQCNKKGCQANKKLSKQNETITWDGSLYDVFIDQVFPYHGPFRKRTERVDNTSTIYVLGTSSLRCLWNREDYNVYSGQLNMDDAYTVDPFNNPIKLIKDVAGSDVQSMIDLNTSSSSFRGLNDNNRDNAFTPMSDHYRWSKGTIDPEKKYDIVCPSYECSDMIARLNAIQPEAYTLSSTDYSFRDIYIEYIGRFWQCYVNSPKTSRTFLTLIGPAVALVAIVILHFVLVFIKVK